MWTWEVSAPRMGVRVGGDTLGMTLENDKDEEGAYQGDWRGWWHGSYPVPNKKGGGVSPGSLTAQPSQHASDVWPVLPEPGAALVPGGSDGSDPVFAGLRGRSERAE